jgi:hypothetical protein
MDSFSEFLKQKSKVINSYTKRIKREARIWKGFSEEQKRLEKFVADEFGRVLKEIGSLPVSGYLFEFEPDQKDVEILDYKVEYKLPEETGLAQGSFSIKITKLKLPSGKIMDDSNVLSSQYGCPHRYLEGICGHRSLRDELHPKMREFAEKYHVDRIKEPNNDCEHK